MGTGYIGEGCLEEMPCGLRLLGDISQGHAYIPSELSPSRVNVWDWGVDWYPLSSILVLKQLRGRGEALFFAACPAAVAFTSKLLPK